MPPTLRNIPHRKVARALRKLGFEIDSGRGKGSHAVVFHPRDARRRTIFPDRDPVATGTLRAMLRDLSVTREEFERALDS